MSLPPSGALFTPSSLSATMPRRAPAPTTAPAAAARPPVPAPAPEPEPLDPSEAAALLGAAAPAFEDKPAPPLSDKQRERIERLMAAVKAEVQSSLEARMFESSDSRDPA